MGGSQKNAPTEIQWKSLEPWQITKELYGGWLDTSAKAFALVALCKYTPMPHHMTPSPNSLAELRRCGWDGAEPETHRLTDLLIKALRAGVPANFWLLHRSYFPSLKEIQKNVKQLNPLWTPPPVRDFEDA